MHATTTPLALCPCGASFPSDESCPHLEPDFAARMARAEREWVHLTQRARDVAARHGEAFEDAGEDEAAERGPVALVEYMEAQVEAVRRVGGVTMARTEATATISGRTFKTGDALMVATPGDASSPQAFRLTVYAYGNSGPMIDGEPCRHVAADGALYDADAVHAFVEVQPDANLDAWVERCGGFVESIPGLTLGTQTTYEETRSRKAGMDVNIPRKGRTTHAAQGDEPACGANLSRDVHKGERFDPWNKRTVGPEWQRSVWVRSFEPVNCKACLRREEP